MKKKMAFLCAIILSLANCISAYASTNSEKISVIGEIYGKEIIETSVIHENILENKLEYLESKYDLSLNMPDEVVEELSLVAKVSKNIQKLDDTHVQVTYNIVSQEPVAEKTFISGNTEKTYSATNYTYVMNTSAIDSGIISETSTLSDVTFKNTVYYSFYENNSVRMLRLDSGVTSITKFLESNLRDLVLNAYCLGATNNGVHEESDTYTIGSPWVGSEYAWDIDFEYYYNTSVAHILYGASVTYSHGLSSYTVNSNITLGSVDI